MTTNADEVHRSAPAAAAALDQLEAAAWSEAARSGRLELIELVGLGSAGQHGLEPLSLPDGSLDGSGGRRRTRGKGDTLGPVDGSTGAEGAVLEFALQFSLDVSAITDGQRSALTGYVGVEAANVAAVIFVMDFLPRTRAALDALVGEAHRVDPVVPGTVSDGLRIWDALIAFARAVARLDALDPVTTELIRLRGARQHECRLCKSLRSRPALLAGAGEELFLEVDEYERSGLSPLQKAALAVTDAMIWTPADIEPSASRLRVLASVEQRVEVVLDVTRNALNKIAVALGADAPHVDEGIEIYDIDGSGDPIFGLTLD